MGDRVTSEKIVGTHHLAGRTVSVVRLTWRDAPGLSYDVVDDDTNDVLTTDESFGEYPTDEQMINLIEKEGRAS